ncbi:hypothetical protein O6P37_00525 [Mycobacterium sp. CPCC 205372]|uniref:Uncharacterized protein n=1 Tax=Mycobacterium hippophais TaxID=3016340 RepID=A0ABT4PL95_9MYCO|nr:hypothetical protein [Mycobacterium hippophais]MCZ8377336.1 hypothetical protein [Mycobacterium hippophais]
MDIYSTMESCRYTLDVLAIDATEAVRAAGGLIYDRVREGWAVRVFTLDGSDGRPLRILGAQGSEYEDITALALSPRRTALALSSAVVSRDDEIYMNTLKRLRRGRAEVILWGDPPSEMKHHLIAIEHRLTSAAAAFKASAREACADALIVSDHTERFHGLGAMCVPGNPDLTPVRAVAD